MTSKNQMIPLDMRIKFTYMTKHGFEINFEKGACSKNHLVIAIEAMECMSYADLDKFIFLANHGFQFSPDLKAFTMNHRLAFTEVFIKEKSIRKIVEAYGEMMSEMTIQ